MTPGGGAGPRSARGRVQGIGLAQQFSRSEAQHLGVGEGLGDID